MLKAITSNCWYGSGSMAKWDNSVSGRGKSCLHPCSRCVPDWNKQCQTLRQNFWCLEIELLPFSSWRSLRFALHTIFSTNTSRSLCSNILNPLNLDWEKWGWVFRHKYHTYPMPLEVSERTIKVLLLVPLFHYSRCGRLVLPRSLVANRGANFLDPFKFGTINPNLAWQVSICCFVGGLGCFSFDGKAVKTTWF